MKHRTTVALGSLCDRFGVPKQRLCLLQHDRNAMPRRMREDGHGPGQLRRVRQRMSFRATCRTGACSPELGSTCSSPCAGTFCQAQSSTCSSSDLLWNCQGTSTLHCTRSCTTDADYAPSRIAMSCLGSCASYPDVGGTCWTKSELSFMRSVCD
jgi:hypothetical protein